MPVITRFAPSPTGFLHIGGARTALFNYLFAKNSAMKDQGSKFLLRIEDTDQKRSTPEAIQAILDGLKWLGIEYDDNYILQSQNQERHVQIANQLLEEDKAYLCYTPIEEIAEMRRESEAKGEVFRFQSPWRDKAMSGTSDVKPVIRLKSPKEGRAIINDKVQGQVEINNNEIDDLVILRSDKTPTYMLAVTVDDHDMGITDIIRGDDHLTNSFKQQVIYNALNWQMPRLTHIPLIHGPDGAKMSKRHGATSVIDYKDLGYLPQALRNYLLRLGWSHGDDEIISDQKAIELFNLENIGKSPARFDSDKLNFFNRHYLKESDDIELLNLIENQLVNGRYELSNLEKDRIVKALPFIKQKFDLTTQLAEPAKVYIDSPDLKMPQDLKLIIASSKELVVKIKNLLQEVDDWSLENIADSLNNFAQENNLKIKDFGPLLRIILTFSNKSAGGIFEIINILGKDQCLIRFDESLTP